MYYYMIFSFPDPIKFFFEEFPAALGATWDELRALGSIFGGVLLVLGLLMVVFARRLRIYHSMGILIGGFLLCCICGFDYGWRYYGYF